MHDIAAVALAFFLIAVGIAHFLVPGYFRTLVPSWLDRPGTLVAASGVLEIIVGTLVLVPRARTVGGWTAAALIGVYLASHFDALRRSSSGQRRCLDRPVGAVVRLAVNVLYIGWAVAVALTAA